MTRLPAGVWGGVKEAISTKFRGIREKPKTLMRSERRSVGSRKSLPAINDSGL